MKATMKSYNIQSGDNRRTQKGIRMTLARRSLGRGSQAGETEIQWEGDMGLDGGTAVRLLWKNSAGKLVPG